MILNFKSQFVPKILDGSKIHTIRKGKRWKPGMKIHVYSGNRFKSDYIQFDEKVCTGVQKIKIQYASVKDRLTINIDGKWLFADEISELARRDGFKYLLDFIGFFFPNLKSGTFTGQIIHWTNFKY